MNAGVEKQSSRNDEMDGNVGKKRDNSSQESKIPDKMKTNARKSSVKDQHQQKSSNDVKMEWNEKKEPRQEKWKTQKLNY